MNITNILYVKTITFLYSPDNDTTATIPYLSGTNSQTSKEKSEELLHQWDITIFLMSVHL